MAFIEICGQLLRDQKSAEGVQGMNVIRDQPFDRAANASDSPRPLRFQNFFMNGAPWLCSIGLPTKLAYCVHQTRLYFHLAHIKNVLHVRQHFENNQVVIIIIITDLRRQAMNAWRRSK
jgi:hypothetical protein